MKSQVKYNETQLSLLLITLLSQILKLCFTAKTIQAFCVSLSIYQKNIMYTLRQVTWSRKSEKQSNELFTFDELRMFSLTRLPVRQQMFLLFHKDYFYIQIPPLVWCVMPRNPLEIAITTTQTKIPNYIHNIDRNMANVFYNQSSRCFSNIYLITYQPGQLAFH